MSYSRWDLSSSAHTMLQWRNFPAPGWPGSIASPSRSFRDNKYSRTSSLACCLRLFVTNRLHLRRILRLSFRHRHPQLCTSWQKNICVVKEFRQKAASHVVSLLRTAWCLSPHTAIDNGMIPFAAYAAAETPSVFQCAGHSRREISTPSNTWDHASQTPYLDRFSRFCGAHEHD